MKRILTTLTLSAALAYPAWSDVEATEYVCGEPSIHTYWRYRDDVLQDMLEKMPTKPFKVNITNEQLKSVFWGDGRLVGKSYYPSGKLASELYILGLENVGMLTVVEFSDPLIKRKSKGDKELRILSTDWLYQCYSTEGN